MLHTGHMPSTTANTAHTAKCSRCHRSLRSPSSVAAGIGPRCAAIEAAFDGLDSRQQDKARDAIDDGAVAATSHEGVAHVVSEDGTEVHLASVNGNCSCAHGVRTATATAKTCWHPGAARLYFSSRRVLRRSDFAKAA
jgi:hypothetical protein